MSSCGSSALWSHKLTDEQDNGDEQRTIADHALIALKWECTWTAEEQGLAFALPHIFGRCHRRVPRHGRRCWQWRAAIKPTATLPLHDTATVHVGNNIWTHCSVHTKLLPATTYPRLSVATPGMATSLVDLCHRSTAPQHLSGVFADSMALSHPIAVLSSLFVYERHTT